jgi:hypothetical protein
MRRAVRSGCVDLALWDAAFDVNVLVDVAELQFRAVVRSLALVADLDVDPDVAANESGLRVGHVADDERPGRFRA